MKTKKFGTFILILTLLMEMLGSFSVAAKAYTVNEEVYNEAGNALLNFGLIQEYSDDKIETDKITRLDYVNIIVKVFEALKSNEEYTENSFSDVADNSEAAKTLAFAKKISLISGDTNGTFRPKDYITPNEAMAISLNALGYSVINGQAIGFNKYIDKARELKLSKNADTSKGYLTFGDAYVIIYNTLNTEMMLLNGISSGVGRIEYQYNNRGEKTLLETYLGISRVDGIFEKNEVTGIKGDGLSRDNAYSILCKNGDEETVYDTDEHKYEGLFGMNVAAYYKESNSRNDLVFMTQNYNKNSVININGADIIDYSENNRRLNYYAEKDSDGFDVKKKETYKTIPVTVNIVYNSYYVEDNKEVFKRINEAAEGKGELNLRNIALIDNDNDKTIDVMVVNMYSVAFVDKVTSNKNVIDYYSKDEIKLSGENRKIIILNAESDKMAYTDIKEKDVLSIEDDINGDQVRTIYVTRDVMEATLKSVSVQGNEYIFEINNSDFTLSNMEHRQALYEKISTGEGYSFYRDITGKIVAAIMLQGKYRYAYVVNTGYDDSEENLILEVFEPDDSNEGASLKKYETAMKCKINGTKIASVQTAAGEVAYKMIKFRCNLDNKVMSIETPKAQRGNNVFSYCYPEEASEKKKLRYRPNWRMFISASALSDDVKANNIAIDDDSTIILNVPLSKDVKDKRERCARLKSLDDLTDGQEYYVDGIICDENEIACKFLLLYFDNTIDDEVFSNKRVFVVDTVAQALNNEEMPASLIEGMENKVRAAYTSSLPKFINHETGNPIEIHKGDILQINVNAFGDAESVRRIYDAENDSYDALPRNVSPTNGHRVTIGSPFDVNGMFFTLVEKDSAYEQANAETFSTKGAYIYVYDRDTDKVSLGTYRDIAARNDIRIVVRARNQNYTDIVIYKY